MTIPLNSDQELAVDGIESWLADASTEPRVLSGPAGTGKTHCVKAIRQRVRGKMVYTAPTNKATRVLRTAMSTEDYKPECRTVYSLLGLRLEANGEVKELAVPDEPIDLSQYRCVVVDEGYMVNSVVEQHLQEAADSYGFKLLYVGDPYQLPPVGEEKSPIVRHSGWNLTKVERFDNQILALAVHLRECVEYPLRQIKLEPNHSETEGVWKLSNLKGREKIRSAAESGAFQKIDSVKVISWRNTQVDSYNSLIRKAIFGEREALLNKWLPGDRVLFTSPAKDLTSENPTRPIATTDDEGTVEALCETYHPEYGDFKVFRLTLNLDDNRVVTAYTLHPSSEHLYTRKLEDLAQLAHADRRRWRYYWEFKDAFHQLRHSYAITAHRSQGSTYNSVFVDWQDILLNRTMVEARKCLYVACTRPKQNLVLIGG